MSIPYSSFVNDALGISGYGTEWADPWTDRLIFALDNRLANYEIKRLAQAKDVLLMQRGWMDSYIHGAVQGLDYKIITQLLQTVDLIKPSYSIYLNCQPKTAYKRIKNDTNADKFETPAFMKLQHRETKRFYEQLNRDDELKKFFSEPRCYIDTTNMTIDETERIALNFIHSTPYKRSSM